MNCFLYFQSAFQINLVFFSFGLLLLSLILFYFEHQRHFSNSFQHSSHLSVGMSSLCQFGSLWMGMFNLLTNSKLNESFNPLHHLSLQQQPGEVGKFKYLLIFHHFLPRFGYFPIGQTKKKITSICIPKDGNFLIFENSTLSSRRKSDIIFPCIFSRIRYTVTFCELWPYVILFHSSFESQLTWSTFPKKIVKFLGQQIACIINKKISFTMLSVSVFLLWCKTPKTPK